MPKRLKSVADVIEDATRRGVFRFNQNKAIDWFRATAETVATNPRKIIRDDPSRLTVTPKIGKMYMYYYYPKYAKTLPYWDRFPCIFPVELYSDGWAGLNLHYLPITLRAKLMDELLTIASDDRMDERTKLTVSYKVLKGASRFSYFKPCYKRYLKTHMSSPLVEFHADEWNIVSFLPVERFQKASKETVWQESRNAAF